MKKVFLMALAMVIVSASFSQVRYGVQAIGGISGISTEVSGVENPKSHSVGAFGGGIVAEVPLSGNWSLRPSLNYLQKNGKITFAMEGQENTLKPQLNFIELPVDVAYSIAAGNNKVFFSAGPSIGYGLSGKIKYNGWDEGENGPMQVSDEVKAFSKDENTGAGLKRLDVSAHFTTGLQMTNGLFVNAGYLVGLTNLASEGGKYKTGGLHLTIGYLIGKK